MPDRNIHGPNGPEDSDDDIASLFAGAPDGDNESPVDEVDETEAARDIDDIDVDDDADAYEPAFPPVPSTPPRPAPSLPDPRAAPPTFEIPELSMPVPPRQEPGPRPPSTRLPSDGEKTFFWGLTPNDEPDPLVHGPETEDDTTDVADREPSGGGDGTRSRGLVPPTVPLAPYVPPVFVQPGEPGGAEAPRGSDEPGGPDEPGRSEEPAEPELTTPIPQAPPGAAIPSAVDPEASAPVTPPDGSQTVAMPTWIPAAPPRQEPEAPAVPPTASLDEGEESSESTGPSEPSSSEPSDSTEPSAPGTVTLPWLRRSRASRAADQVASGEPGESAGAQDAFASPAPSDSAASGLPLQGDDAASGAGGASSAGVDGADADTGAAASSSWSLFGDLFGEREQASDAGNAAADTADGSASPAAPDIPDATRPLEVPDAPDLTEPDHDGGKDAGGKDDDGKDAVGKDAVDETPNEPVGTATDLFAALEATSATAAIPGASAGQAAAYDVPERDQEAPAWPWGASAVAPVPATGAEPPTAALPLDGSESPFAAESQPAADEDAIDAPDDEAHGSVSAPTPAAPAAPVAAASPAASAPVAADAQPTRTRRARRSGGGGTGSRNGSGSSGSVASGGTAAGSAGGGRFGGAGLGQDDDSDGPSPRAQRVMLIVAGAMLFVLLLIALFIVGRTAMHPVALSTPSPSPSKTATPTPTPTATVAATGPQAPGKHPWDSLRGGECLQPFTTAWAESFTVVDCAAPHAGQMVYTGVFSADPKAAFPGADQLASQINVLCSRPGVLNLDAAGQYDDAQLQGSYSVTEKQWKSGQRSYYCFVSRSSGQPITGSLAGSGPQ